MTRRRQAWWCAAGFAVLLWAAPAGADPRTDWVLHCQGCHLPDGRGQPGAVPDLRGTLGRFLAVEGGREYLVQVPGTAQAELSDARIAALLGWMLTEFSPGSVPEGFAPYTAEEVGALRREPLLDAEARRDALLRRIVDLPPAVNGGDSIPEGPPAP